MAADDNFALQVAAFHGHTEIFKLLLAKDRGNYIHPSITDDGVINVMLTIYEGRDSLLKESFLKAMLSLRVMASIVWEDRKIPRAIAQRRDLLSIIEESREETLKIMRICYDISLKTNHDNAILVIMFLYGKQLIKEFIRRNGNSYEKCRNTRSPVTIHTDDVSIEDITYPSSSTTTPASIERYRDSRPPATIHTGAGAADVARMEGIDHRTMSAGAPAGERDDESSQPACKRPRPSLS